MQRARLFQDSYIRTCGFEALVNLALLLPLLALGQGSQSTTVLITSPINGTLCMGGDSLTLTATASASGGNITKVEFFEGERKIGEDNNSPYRVTWANVSQGAHTITVQATDSSGNTALAHSRLTVLPAGSTLRVMPFGDSFTDGFNVPGSYRIHLWEKLTTAGFSVNFVGSLNNGPSQLPDRDHEGHSGTLLSQFINAARGWVEAAQPQIVLLLVGNTDILTDTDLANAPIRLSALIDQITAGAPEAHVIVSTLTPWTSAVYNRRILNYNAVIPSIVASKAAAGKSVSFLNMYPAFGIADLADDIHPAESGYDKMAEYWYGALLPVLTCQPPPQIHLTAPVNETIFTAPANITISAAVESGNGPIAKVEFFEDDVKIGEDTSPPFAMSRTNLTSGTFRFSARVVEVSEAAAVSESVVVRDNMRLARGVNLAGAAVMIDGYQWMSYSNGLANGLTVSPNAFVVSFDTHYTFPLIPAPTADVQTMLESVLTASLLPGEQFSIRQVLPNGNYHVYLWTIENHADYFRSFDVVIEGLSVAAGAGDLPRGAWRKYGPFPVNLTDGALDIAFVMGSKGNYPGLCGLEIFEPSLANSPPRISSIADQRINIGGISGSIPFTISDSETAADALTLSAASSNPSLIPAEGIIFTGTSTERALTITPVRSGFGASLITVTVKDALGGFATETLLVAVNQPGFVRGINLYGPPVNIEGQRWLSHSEALSSGFSLSSADGFNNGGPYSFPVTPSASDDTDFMLRTCAYTSGGSATGMRLTQTVTNGSYDVYLWLFENFSNGYRDVVVKLEGATVASGIGDLPKGEWRKYGPYSTAVTDGNLQIELARFTKGDPGLFGLAIFQGSQISAEPALSISDIPDQSAAEDAVVSPINFSAFSDALAANNLTFSVSSSNADLVPEENITILGQGSTRSVRLVLATNRFGASSITVTAKHPVGLTAADTFMLTVFPVNDPPIAFGQSITTAENTSRGMTLTAFDPETTNLTFTLLTFPARGALASPASGALTGLARFLVYTPAHGYSGSDSFSFRFADASTNGAEAFVNITVNAAADSDSDGIPDVWEIARGLNPNLNDAGVDLDNDGMSNLSEYLADTDPSNAASRLAISSVTVSTNNKVRLTWPSIGGTRYRLQYSTNGFEFHDFVRPAQIEMDPLPPGTLSEMSFSEDFTRSGGIPRAVDHYYRIKVVR